MRIPFATTLKSRDGTLDQDAKVVNGIIEPDGESAPTVRRRPGLLDMGLVRAGAAQLLYYWYGKIRTVIGDYIGVSNYGPWPSASAVSLLLHMDGANASTTFTDSSGNAHTVTAGGDAKLTTTAAKYGTACGTFDGTGDYLSVPAHSAFNFGTGDFTIEAWVKIPPGGYVNYLFSESGGTRFVANYAGNDLTFWLGGVQVAASATIAALNDGEWHHVAVTRSGTSIRIFFDGAQTGSTATSAGAAGSAANTIIIGAFSAGSTHMTGQLDDYRVVKGEAVYTANFTPATEELGYGTSILYGLANSAISPTDSGLQFSAQDNGANSPESLLMIKNASQAWVIDAADTVTQITDTDYPGTYAVTLTSLTSVTTTATATVAEDTNFQVGSTVVIAGATPAGYNGSKVILSVGRSGQTVPPPTPIGITITRSGTTATAMVKVVPHGFTNGQTVTISGAVQDEYNGDKTITWVSPTQFSFTVTVTSGTAASPVTPATGSPALSVVRFAVVAISNYDAGSMAPLIGGDYQNFRATAMDGPHGMSNGGTAKIYFNATEYTITASNVTASTFEFAITGWSAPSTSSIVDLRVASLPTISSITRVGTTATVTTSAAHGFSSSDIVYISGATQGQYNAFGKSITVTSATQFTFSIDGAVTDATPDDPITPATGIITAQGPATVSGSSFTFAVDASLADTATGTITATGGRNTVPGIAYINGYFCVMDEQGVVYNSAQDDPENWNALEFTSALNEPGAGVAIAKSGNFIAAFKEWSTEFFYDAQNPTESPLSPVDNGFTLIGCAQGWSVANVDGSLMWIAQSKKHKGRQIYRMSGTEQAAVSTPDVERVLNADSLATVYAWGARLDGHPCYVLSLVASGVTLVYDAVSQAWYQWTSLTLGSSKSISSITRSGTTATVTFAAVHGLSDGDPLTISGATQTDYNGTFQVKYVSTTAVTIEVENSPVTPATGTILGYPYTESYLKWSHYTAANGADVILDVSDGHLYEIDPAVTQDDGVPVNFFIRTARLDGGGTGLKKVGSLRVIGEKVSDTAMARWSDDDSATFTKYRDVDLSAKEPELRRCGSFRRRSYELRHVGASIPRVTELEMGMQ